MMHNSQGTTDRPKLDDAAFEAFIRGRRPASPIWSMSGLDGYLTALIIGPKFIDPRKWIPELTGPDALNLPMETTEHRAVQTIVAEYNRISGASLKPRKTTGPGSPGSMIKPLIRSIGTSAFAGNRIRAETLAAGSSRSCRHRRYHCANSQARRDKTQSHPPGCR